MGLTGGGMNMHRKPNTAPLRKIVATRWNHETGRIVETYECGHERPQPTDIYGPTNAYRRRCRKCRPAPPDQAQGENGG